MTDTFTASNGYRVVAWDKETGIRVHNTGHVLVHELGKYAVDALREYFQAERDNELGRWRWPEHPEFVVISKVVDGVRVVSERTGGSLNATRDQYAAVPGEATFYGAARAYFDAHPEPKKPWEDAEAGEVWALTFRGGETSWFVKGAYFQNTRTFTNILPTDKFITAGRRIYPEATE